MIILDHSMVPNSRVGLKKRVYGKNHINHENNRSQEAGTANDSDVNQEPDLGLIEAYQILWKIMRNKNMPIVCLVFFTYSFPFSAAESSYKIQLVQMGISNDTIAQTSLPLIAVKIITVMVVTKFTTGPRPLNVFLAMYPCRLVMCLALAGLVSSSFHICFW